MCGRLISLNLVLPRGFSARRDFPTHARGGKWPFAFGRQVATCRSEGRGPRSEFEAPRPSRLSLFVVIRHGSTTCLGHGSTPSTVGEVGEVGLKIARSGYRFPASKLRARSTHLAPSYQCPFRPKLSQLSPCGIRWKMLPFFKANQACCIIYIMNHVQDDHHA